MPSLPSVLDGIIPKRSKPKENFMKLIILLFTLATLTSCAHHKNKKHRAGNNHHEQVWKGMDVNNDGKVSKEEFSKNQETHFANMDKDSDGFVTEGEKVAFMSTHHSSKSRHDGYKSHYGKSCDKKDCKNKKSCDEKKDGKYGESSNEKK